MLYYSPMLLGLCLLLAVAIAATALWQISRPYSGPGFWMAGSWSLIGGIGLFIAFILTGSPTLNVLGNAAQLAGEALFLLGIFRFMGRQLPWWIVPLSVSLMVLFNIHYWMFDGHSDFLMGIYSTIAGLLPAQAVWLLLREKSDPATRPARLLVGISLLIYSAVTLLRGYLGYRDWWLDAPYINPYESFSYLLPYNFAIPALVMGFIGVTLMTMQRILANSEIHAEQARHNALRFERLLGATTSAVMIVKTGLIQDANRRLEQLTGLSRQSLLQQPVITLFPSQSRNLIEQHLSRAHASQLDVDALHTSGKSFPAEISIAPLSADSNDLLLEIRDVSHRKALEQQLQLLATQDSLTGALNRRAFNERAQQEFKRAARYQQPLSLAILDLDHFKSINDSYGHLAGDHALQQFAGLCRRLLRESDIFSRFGGEEFVVLLTQTDDAAAMALLERLRQEVSKLALQQGAESFGLRVSVGLATWQAGDQLDSLFKRADQALYAAKSSGRNRVISWTDDVHARLADV
ncbi:diguanylate cyclase [Halopseudomonas pelagia]|uniref:diguanylate cyclase n=2 Tax=Halopseudomonas pelagia TaxID=553151 RepID=UPI00126885BB